jgi:hypothetical protein
VNQDVAQAIGLQALAYIAADERRLGALLVQAGWTLAELRASLSDPAAIAGILDFLLSDERLVLGFCEHAGLPPQVPMQARRALPGAGDGA